MIDRPVVEYIASTGARIFRLPLEVFPQYQAFAHLVLHNDVVTLVDTGSGYDTSNKDLLAGFASVRDNFLVNVDLANVRQVILTHGHIDHIGGLGFVLQNVPEAHIAAHELVRPLLTNYQQRMLMTHHSMARFLRIAGVPSYKQADLLEMYLFGKRDFEPVSLHTALQDNEVFDNTFRVIHVPGHSPGLVMLKIGDILLTADHILPNTSVVLAPEMIMPSTGVGHYLESLAKAERLDGVRIALGGHEEPMDNYYQVVRHARDKTVEKVNVVQDLCVEPRTIYEIACLVYDDMDGYTELLKLEQIGARAEYLYQRGLVTIANLDEIDDIGQDAWRFLRTQ